MADHPFDTAAETVDANVTPGGVTETLLDEMKKRTSLALGATETLGDFDFSAGSPPNAVVYGATGYVYFYNADDTTSPDDGSTCLVSMDGRRYILADMSAMAISAVLAIDNDPPVSPVDGDAYVLGAAPTGAWVGHAKDIALQTPRGWVFAQPKVGTALLNIETAENIQYSAAGSWGPMSTALDIDGVVPEELLMWGGLSVEAQQNAPPVTPAVGDYYLVGLTPSGAWTGHENDIGYYTSTSTWAFLAAYDGARIYNKASGADLAWFDAAGAWRASSPSASLCQGRLTLESGVPISITDQSAKATLFFTPFRGNFVSLYSNGGWSTIDFAEVSISLAGYTASRIYDIFGYLDGADLALESLIWTNATTRATVLALQDGIPVLSSDHTRRYLGSVLVNSTGGQTDLKFGGSASGGSAAFVGLWNYNNRVPIELAVQESADSWSYATAAWRAANGSNAMRVTFVSGLAEDCFSAQRSGAFQNNAGTDLHIGIGLDSVSALAARCITSGASIVTSSRMSAFAFLNALPVLGSHYVQALEYGGFSGAFYGDAGLPGVLQTGLSMSWFY